MFPSRVLLVVLLLRVISAVPAWSQTGVIAFRDACNKRLYAMHANGSGRILLPFPPLPLPTDLYEGAEVLDVTTSGPLTVVYRVRIERAVIIDGQPDRIVLDRGLFAVQVEDVGGVLTTDPEVRLTLPAVPGFDPNNAHEGSFSAMELGDRLALVAANDTTNLLMTARVDRDAALKIVGLSDLVEVGEGLSAGAIDYSPYENSIVTSIDADLWLIHLAGDNSFLSSELLTMNSEGFAEWNPAWAPDGSLIAFTRGQFRGPGPGVGDTDIYTFDVVSSSLARVTNVKNKGNAGGGRDQAMWSLDSESIGFFAFAKARMPRNSPCSGLVNSEIFVIPADGSATATQITNTNGTSAEYRPAWGW